MIVFSLSVVVPRSRRNDVVHTVGALLGPTRATPGCIECRLYADYENQNAFTLVEEWTTQAALDRHLASDAYKTLVSAIELSTKPPRIRFDNVVQRGGLEVIAVARQQHPET
jgi:quinol monooxygenase YgiN